MMNIGFIGVGTMGKGMVKNLLKSGFKVFAYNRTKSKVMDIKHENLTVVDDPKDIPRSADVVFTCVSDDDALKEVLFSDQGLFKTITGNSILIDCSTSSEKLTQEIFEKCKEENIEFLDAPITGSKLGAENGELLFMIGGNKEVYEKLNSVWDAMGKKSIYCGISGYGQKAKHALNLTQSLILQSYLEGLVFGMKNNVPLEVMRDVLDNSGAKCGVGTFKLPYIMKRDFEPHFLFKLMYKDLKLAYEDMKRLGIKLPLSLEILKQFQKGHEFGLDEEDLCSLVKLLENESGVKVE